MTSIINLAALFLLMLVTGVFWGPWFAFNRSLQLFTAPEFIKITKTLSVNLGTPMRFMLPGCIILMLIAVCLFPGRSALPFFMGIASIVFIIALLIITLAIEDPIVKKMERWTADNYPADWMDWRNKWQKFHIYRVLTAFVSFLLFAWSILK